MSEILKKISLLRETKIKQLGFGFGFEIPQKREVPLCPPDFKSLEGLHAPLLIAEIKRASPSAKDIGAIKNPLSLAQLYLDSGAKVISVLTEQEHFKGSLDDLMLVKNAYKNATILRKDFLQFPEEMTISYLAGADMVLLIVAMFLENKRGFEALVSEARNLKLSLLFEVHSYEEFAFLRPYKPEIIGINARSLHTFEIHKQNALILAQKIRAQTDSKIIFESGINSSYDGFVIGANELDGMLCGSYFVKEEEKRAESLQNDSSLSNPSLQDDFSPQNPNPQDPSLPNHPSPLQNPKNSKSAVALLISSYQKGKKMAQRNPFFKQIFLHLATKTRPLIKICGITNLDDAIMCAKNGADMLGFIMVDKSLRKITPHAIKQISKAIAALYPDVLKIGVIHGDKEVLKEARTLLDQGILDALQLHSAHLLQKNPRFAGQSLAESGFAYYPCINLDSPDDYPRNEFLPFILLDSKSALGGGSGKSIDLQTLKNLQAENLFLAGGIGTDNLHEILSLNPRMLDVNSKLEKAVGIKDGARVRDFFNQLQIFYKD